MGLGIYFGSFEGLRRNFGIVFDEIVDTVSVLQPPEDRIDSQSGSGYNRRTSENFRTRSDVVVAGSSITCGLAERV